MTILERAIDAASGDGSIDSVLSLMKILAVRTGAEELGKWVGYEQSGYPDEIDVPRYRGPIQVDVYGDFMTERGATRYGVAIDTSEFPEGMRGSWLFKHAFHQPAAVVQGLMDMPDEQLRFGWPAEYVSGYNKLVYSKYLPPVMPDGWYLQRAIKGVSKADVRGVLAGIKNAALDLALQLGKEAPGAGEADASRETKEKAVTVVNNNQIFNINNADFSQSNNAFGSTTGDQSLTVTIGNRESLVAALREAGVENEDIASLRNALDDDGDVAGRSEVGPGVGNWLKSLATKVGTVVATTATNAVLTYYGMPILPV